MGISLVFGKYPAFLQLPWNNSARMGDQFLVVRRGQPRARSLFQSEVR
jgi:hypothetical protein